ncbi:uncharacterized protein AruCF_1653 [Achromobacter ruhlandii]|nr:uncharacterized protein AruCF_1653 [Achromobacter ruhlandii]
MGSAQGGQRADQGEGKRTCRKRTSHAVLSLVCRQGRFKQVSGKWPE